MKIKLIYFLLLLFLILSFYFISYYYFSNNEMVLSITHHSEKQHALSEKAEMPEHHPVITQQNALWKYINKDIDTFVEQYGEPKRKDPSLYGYEWWVYQDENIYFNIAVKNNQIVSLYSNRSGLDFTPVSIGQDVQEINKIYTFSNEIEFNHIKFKLTEKDIKERPLITLTDQIFAQLYIDIFTNKVAGIRVINKKALEILKPYELYYVGEVNKAIKPNKEEWKEIENGLEKKTFELTNELRKEYNIESLSWDENASQAAKLHSEDMKKENYFSHYSLNGDGLKERLLRANAYYLSAGENIAAHYKDAIAVVHGWLNSEGHRESILKKEYTHLGVGVHQSYYTQNFLKK